MTFFPRSKFTIDDGFEWKLCPVQAWRVDCEISSAVIYLIFLGMEIALDEKPDALIRGLRSLFFMHNYQEGR